MKKSLIALAVAATAATPMAASAAMLQAANPDQSGINLYGSFRPQIVSQDTTSFSDGASRWGVMGEEDLGNGMAALYRFERSFSTVDATQGERGRLAYAGLKGGFGALIMGNQWTPYYNVIGSPSDIFASAGINNYIGTARSDRALAYALPAGLPIGGAIAYVNEGEDAGGDAVNGGFTLGAGPVTIGLGFHDADALDDTVWGLSVGGNFGGFGATVMVEDAPDGSTPFAVTGTFAGFALQYQNTDSGVDEEAWTAGYTYRISSGTRLQFAYETADGVDDDKFVARYRVDF